MMTLMWYLLWILEQRDVGKSTIPSILVHSTYHMGVWKKKMFYCTSTWYILYCTCTYSFFFFFLFFFLSFRSIWSLFERCPLLLVYGLVFPGTCLPIHIHCLDFHIRRRQHIWPWVHILFGSNMPHFDADCPCALLIVRETSTLRGNCNQVCWNGKLVHPYLIRIHGIINTLFLSFSLVLSFCSTNLYYPIFCWPSILFHCSEQPWCLYFWEV